MSIFSAIKSFFTNKTVDSAISAAVGSTTVGGVLETAMNLGAFNFIAGLIGKTVTKLTGSKSDLSTSLMLAVSKSIVDTMNNTALITDQEKRDYALVRFKNYLSSDITLEKYPTLVVFAPVLIEIVYQTNKLKTLLDKQNRDQIIKIMQDVSAKALADPTIDPVKTFLDELNALIS